MILVNFRVVKYNFKKQKSKLLTIAEPKGTNCLFRKSNIIPDVVLTALPFWESDLNTILVFEIMGM